MASAPNAISSIPHTIDQMEACRSDIDEVCKVMFPPYDIQSGTFCTRRQDYARG
jgi:methyl coenzyme M reductase subunit D